MDKKQVMAMMQSKVDGNLNVANNTSLMNSFQDMSSTKLNADYKQGMTGPNTLANMSAWGYWQDYYYPQVIRESYPVYIQERAMDKGKKAFEIIKMLKDKDFVKLNRVGDFIDLMDALIREL